MSCRRVLSILPAVLAVALFAPVPAVADDPGGAEPQAASPPPAERPTAAIDLAARLPDDSAVVRGVLPNGLQYFIRQNPKPENRVELRLALKVGSIQEEEAERGIAHFVEHMNFNGTKTFPAGELVKYLESIGSKFGADQNAYTSFDETVYQLQVPTDKEGALDKGLLIMSEWAGAATMTGKDIDDERGVVLDELRGNKGAGKRMRDKQMKVTLRGSRYPDRMPIGLEEVITSAPHDVVKGFYTKWYRPDLMALIVVGDIEPAAIETRVRELFGAIAAPANPMKLPVWPVPAHEETLYTVETDAEQRANSFQIIYKQPVRLELTGLDSVKTSIEGLAGALLSLRLGEIAQSSDPPFLGAGAGAGGFVKTIDAFSASARAKDGELVRAATALVQEIERARQHGFLASELDRVKVAVLESNESSFRESEKLRSEERIGGIVDSFLGDEPLPSDRFQYDFTKQIVPTIALEQINEAFRRLTEPRNRVVLVQAPLKEGVAVPTVAELEAVVEPEGGHTVEAYKDDMSGKELIPPPPPAGVITSRRPLAQIGASELTLSNGMRVILKVTDFRSDEVSMRAFAHGGTASFGARRHQEANRAHEVANESGLGELTAPQFTKWMIGSGKLAEASTWASWFTRGFGGSARPADVDLMLQLAHLRFTRPAFREDALARVKQRAVQYLTNQLNSPQGVYSRRISEVVNSNHWLVRTPEIAEIESLTLAPMEAAYRDMHDDASEWTVVIVGNIDPAKHEPLIATWLGSLPTTSSKPKVTLPHAHDGIGIRFPKGQQVIEVVKGIEDQSRTSYMLNAPHDLDAREQDAIDALTDLLDIRLRDQLREERGDTYGVSVGWTTYSPLRTIGRIGISFGSAPATREAMLKDVKAAISKIRRELATPEEIEKVRALRRNSLDEAEKENGYWLDRISTAYMLERPLDWITGERMRIDDVNAERIRAAARRYLDTSNSVEVHLVPERIVGATKPTAPPAVATPAPAPTPDPAPAPAGR